MKGAKASTSEYKRAQTALGRGVQAQTVGQRTAATSRAQAAGMGDVANVQAGQVGQGVIGQSLMNQALQRANSTGQLSAEASRDATQAARSGMAARGMATGSAGLAAEMLNRDRFARQRQAEDLAFAQGVQGQDLTRQFQNVGNNMQASLANQQTQFGRQQIMSGNQQQANMANMQAANQMAQYNTTLGADTDRYNAGQRDATGRYNLGLLGTSAAMAEAERGRQLGTQQDIYNFQMQTNPRLMLAGLGSPFANMSQPALGAVSGITGSVNPIYTGGQFSGGGGFNMMGAGMGALGGAATGAMIGGAFGGVGAIPGALLGGLAGAAGGGMSDKREKTDLKKIDGPTNVIGIPSYEYRYKGEKKKRRGVMAQDVQKVLPEAVAEVDYKGKKRLAIKPAVIGAALAEHLAADTKPVALAS
jgi:hypothetical protein